MGRYVPILGTAVLIGAIIQLFLGFQVSADVLSLRDIHMGVGILGVILVIALTVLAFRAKPPVIYPKITMTILTVLVIIQVGLGFQLLSGVEAMIVFHEVAGFLIVLLALLTGGITFMSAKKQAR